MDTVMPGYTHAVQAPPTTVSHFLLAFDAVTFHTARGAQAWQCIC